MDNVLDIETFDLINIDEKSRYRIIGLNGFLSPDGILITNKEATIYTHKALYESLLKNSDFKNYIAIRNGRNADPRVGKFIDKHKDGLICIENMNKTNSEMLTHKQAQAIGNYLKINRFMYYDELDNDNIKQSIGYVILKNSEGFGINLYENDAEKARRNLTVYNEVLGQCKLSFRRVMEYIKYNEPNFSLFNKNNEM